MARRTAQEASNKKQGRTLHRQPRTQALSTRIRYPRIFLRQVFVRSPQLPIPNADRARDADASELGLFTLVAPPAAASTQQVASDVENKPPPALGEIALAEVPAATPLRIPAASDRMVTGSKGKVKDKEPEVYAEAALKYLNR